MWGWGPTGIGNPQATTTPCRCRCSLTSEQVRKHYLGGGPEAHESTGIIFVETQVPRRGWGAGRGGTPGCPSLLRRRGAAYPHLAVSSSRVCGGCGRWSCGPSSAPQPKAPSCSSTGSGGVPSSATAARKTIKDFVLEFCRASPLSPGPSWGGRPAPGHAHPGPWHRWADLRPQGPIGACGGVALAAPCSRWACPGRMSQ